MMEFKLIPEELWDQILDHLTAKDIQNTFLAFPEMTTVLRNRSHLWTFDKVLPLIARQLGQKDLLSCRLLSTLWSKGVDTFLVNHPSRRAYDPDNILPGQNWKLTRRTPPPQDSRFPVDPFSFIYGRYFPKGYSFHSCSIIESFAKDMEGLPPTTNPFAGRSVSINRYPWGGSEEYHEKFWNKIDNLLKIWGEHIWFVEVWEFLQQGREKFYRPLQRILHQLPNLKSLHVEGNGRGREGRWVSELKAFELAQLTMTRKGFPSLPHLETLKMDGCELHVVHLLLGLYSTQLKRLFWSMQNAFQWQDEYGESFPNLTELGLTLPPNITIKEVKSLMVSLKAPKLHRFHIRFWGSSDNNFRMEEVVEALEGFPKLRRFRFHREAMVLPAR